MCCSASNTCRPHRGLGRRLSSSRLGIFSSTQTGRLRSDSLPIHLRRLRGRPFRLLSDYSVSLDSFSIVVSIGEAGGPCSFFFSPQALEFFSTSTSRRVPHLVDRSFRPPQSTRQESAITSLRLRSCVGDCGLALAQFERCVRRRHRNRYISPAHSPRLSRSS